MHETLFVLAVLALMALGGGASSGAGTY